MLTSEENELLCRVEGEAAMGKLMRRHWISGLHEEEVAKRMASRLKSTLLSAKISWSLGAVTADYGSLDEYCPHRRASLASGRNEEYGLRCLYHRWKMTSTATF